MYNEFKDIFEGNKQGFYRKSRPLTYWHRIWRTCGRQSSLANRRETQCVSKLSPGGKKLIRWPAVNILSWGLLIFLFCIFFLFFFLLVCTFCIILVAGWKKGKFAYKFHWLGINGRSMYGGFVPQADKEPIHCGFASVLRIFQGRFQGKVKFWGL